MHSLKTLWSQWLWPHGYGCQIDWVFQKLIISCHFHITKKKIKPLICCGSWGRLEPISGDFGWEVGFILDSLMIYCRTKIEMNNHFLCTFTRMDNLKPVNLWAMGGNSYRHRENMQTLHRGKEEGPKATSSHYRTTVWTSLYPPIPFFFYFKVVIWCSSTFCLLLKFILWCE